MPTIVDNAFTYKFLYNLSKDWKDFKAYELGIIDENGKNLKTEKELKTSEEKKAYNNFHRVVFNLKRLLEKFPLGRTTIARYSAVLALLKEENKNVDTDFIMEYIMESQDEMKENATMGVDMSDGGTFAGCKVFNAPRDTMLQSKDGKKRFARYKTYVGEDELGQKIRDYGRQNPGKGIILRDEACGTMIYLKRPKT